MFYNLIQSHWPILIEQGVVCRLKTPVVVAEVKNKKYEFFDEKIYDEWKKDYPGHKFKYFKGLGSFVTKDFKEFMKDLNKYMVTLSVEDQSDWDSIDLAFNKTRADDRKEWLLGE